MANSLNSAEVLADTISQKVEQLLSERSILHSEYARKSFCSLEQEKAFVQAYQTGIINSAFSALKTAKLEHMLMMR